MAATLKRILAKVESCGLEYFCFNAEISPHGPGTRRFVLGKHIELPKKIEKMPDGKFRRGLGEQEYLCKPMPALEFEEWLDNHIMDLEKRH